MQMLVQIGFTALALAPNTSDSSEKQKWLDVLRKENDKMVSSFNMVFDMLFTGASDQHVASWPDLGDKGFALHGASSQSPALRLRIYASLHKSSS